MFNVDELRASGFSGFQPLLGLNTDAVPSAGGVYVVLTDRVGPPGFLPVSCGGHFKQKDPTVSESILRSKWVDGCSVVYIGKATSLRSRLRQYRDFGRGKPIGHWGGRYIWQLENHADLLVCWRATDEPRRVEQSMLEAFERDYGRLPFANLTR
jgi:hypothetical protein